MSDQINGIDHEWFTELHVDYLEGHALIEDFRLPDRLVVIDEDSLQTTTPESIKPTSLITVDAQRGPPCKNMIDNRVHFTVEISSNDTNKKKYLYSYRLNRIYVDMECDFSVQFNWDDAMVGSQMCVRACVVFADEAQAQKRPECCLQHLHQGANTDVDKHIGLNVLHSSRPMGTAGVEYHGFAEVPDSWLSTVVQLTKLGPEPVAHAYKFVCKSSCSSGINRRAIAVIFTLEDPQGVVYGRQMVGARVCACPRRDMIKDERSEGVFKSGKKRVASNLAQPMLKKSKSESKSGEIVSGPPTPAPFTIDERVITLPTLEIVNARIALTGLEVMLSMSQQALELRPSDSETPKCDESIAKIKQAIQDLKDKHMPNNNN